MAQRVVSIGMTTLVVLLFAIAFWFRVTSLESMPYPDGDEAWYGIQVGHLLTGKPFARFTPPGNPINPFFSGMLTPLMMVSKPRLWLLRVPSVISGIAAVVLTYVLGARIWDR